MMGLDERRRMRRYQCCGRVELPLQYSRVPLFGLVMDINAAGCGVCLPTGTQFVEAEGAECLVELQFRTSYFSFRALAAVRCQYRHVLYEGAMLGLEFVRLSVRARADIAEFIRDQEELRLAA